ncbi:(2Fe-2S) ferredoxin domain-containing protein [Komarekiella sp. 'clone 1']|uniref:(2Fe-2S) ferredoxin domain-containing protein n=1 Tax=Komarekiella delphini-convector SJRDD-AB1 TaxID=2593771 RepID=A0AA40VRI6_9NOST|nr:(2Fe-2S) ferredoxin domain-containing protein [Komarekiella delphini-convector]MBD6617217.1 (2Fe-2S) ferredoxin domain-containing protein [Komarekiella delphini-convector SJRDD-AB1]
MKKLIRRIKALLQRILKKVSSNSQERSPLNSRPLDTSIPAVSPQWKSVVFVCSQCANEQSNSSHRTSSRSTASEDLQNWLKSRLKFEGLWGKFRVVSTSCLGVCPRTGVAVVLVSEVGDGNGQCLIVNPQSDREVLYSRIKQNNG